MHGVLGMARPATLAKTEMEIERLLQWAYRDELSKRHTSSAEGIWDRINSDGQRGGVDIGHGTAQRYDFGLPHPDAEWIEKAVSALPDTTIDWKAEGRAILGHLLNIVDPTPRPLAPHNRDATASWRTKGGVQRSAKLEPPRDVILVKTLRTSALVIMHAKMGTRPDWRSAPPQPLRIPALKGPNAMIVGECRGKSLYSAGSYCPLRWTPSPIGIAEARADYLAWWRGLVQLTDSLILTKFSPLPPLAHEMPWNYLTFGGKSLTSLRQ